MLRRAKRAGICRRDRVMWSLWCVISRDIFVPRWLNWTRLWRGICQWWHQCVIRGNSFDDKGWLGETKAMPVAREPILVLEIVLFSIERIIWIMLNLKVTKCNIIKFHWFLKCLICIMQPATWFVYWQCNASRYLFGICICCYDKFSWCNMQCCTSFKNVKYVTYIVHCRV